jgi:hypothetical protein
VLLCAERALAGFRHEGWLSTIRPNWRPLNPASVWLARRVVSVREADRAEAYAWSVQMEGYGGPAQPTPTIGQCLNGGLGWLYQ